MLIRKPIVQTYCSVSEIFSYYGHGAARDSDPIVDVMSCHPVKSVQKRDDVTVSLRFPKSVSDQQRIEGFGIVAASTHGCSVSANTTRLVEQADNKTY